MRDADVEQAWIEGKPVTLSAAAAEAVRLLAASRLPVIAGLGTDIAGARAAIRLAQRLGAVIDHVHSAALLRDLDVMREAGMMVTTPNEAQLRADVALVVGPNPFAAAPDLAAIFSGPPAAPEANTQQARRIFWLCPGRGGARAEIPGLASHIEMGRDAADLPYLLAALRARVAGRPVAKTAVPAKMLDSLAADLQSARFGVAVWSAAELDSLTIAMLCGLVDDLNAKTRFTGLPIPQGDNAGGVLQSCGWMTGLPMRTGFARGVPEHDPWRFDTSRLVESGEADCVLWISAYGAMPPAWRGVPMIALVAEQAKLRPAPRVRIEIGQPGIDHDAVEHVPLTAMLARRVASRRSNQLSVAQVLERIDAAMQHAGVVDADVH